ncbi:MAG: glycoside hydrolase family 3 C-terminal domain-containing protein [Bacteroidales bacterium]|nr:glycoside hydrolase family 3 C-terminal domain-containing protein [Bacteroidales bacterium]
MNVRNILLTLTALTIILTSCKSSSKLTPSNIDDVVKAMTLEEKAALVVSFFDFMGEDSTVVIRTCPIERLGIPSVTLAAADTITPLGERFPSPLMMASSWDTELIEEAAKMQAHQAVDAGVDVLLAPSLSLMRNILAGDASSDFSEDPLVIGEAAAAFVRGINQTGAVSAMKYLAAANQASYSDKYDACVSPRALREMHLRGFEIAMAESRPSAVMAAGNKINGTWASSNKDLLQRLLRDEWKYDGVVIGGFSADTVAAGKIAAGCDLLSPAFAAQSDSIAAFVADGRLSEEALNRSVKDLLKMIVSTPGFHNGNGGAEDHKEPDFAATARKVAADGIILLENRYSALPLTDSLTGFVSVFEAANDSLYAIKPALESALAEAGCRICNDADSSDVAIVVITRQSGHGDRAIVDFLLTPEEQQLINSTCAEYHADDRYVIVVLNIDAVIETSSWKEQPDAILLAFAPGGEGAHALSDVITGAVNPSGKLTVTFPEHYMFSPSSRNFPARPDTALFERVREAAASSGAGKGFVPSRPGAVRPGRTMGGMRGGQPRSGQAPDSSQAGRMPRRTRSDYMVKVDSTVIASRGERNVDYTLYQEGIFLGYRYYTSFDRPVSYPFGHGLSYTAFEYDEPEVILRRNSMKVFVKITNTGSYAGREVAQLYAVTPESSLDKPLLILAGFAKTPLLEPGESCTVSFTVPFRALASFNSASSAWTVDAGAYILKAGASCTDIRSEVAAVINESYSWQALDILQQQYPINELHLRRSIFRERVRGGGPALMDSIPAAAEHPSAATDSIK